MSRFIFIIIGIILFNTQISNGNEANHSTHLILPKILYVVEGEDIEIFKRSIISGLDIDDYAIIVSSKDSLLKNNMYNLDRKIIFNIPLSTGKYSGTLKFQLYSDINTKLDEQEVQIISDEKKGSPKNEVNILLIGDSFTASGFYPDELKRRLVGGIGDPKTDNLSNINFIGTNHSISCCHEGYSGKDHDYFLGT